MPDALFEWQANAMEALLRDIRDRVKAVKPHLVISAYAPASEGFYRFGFPTLSLSPYARNEQEKVQVVGKRLEKLAINQKLDTPAKMIIWKCGSSCSGHDPAGVAKWIKDVSINFHKINNS